MLRDALSEARQRRDARPPLVVIAASLVELGVALPPRTGAQVNLEEARELWMRRLGNANRSASTLTAYRVALGALIGYLDRHHLHESAFQEETVVAHLDDYRRRSNPAAATYYRRFMLLRRFYRWLSRRAGQPDPFLELEPPAKPRQEAGWLTVAEFERLLDGAAQAKRPRPGLVERDQFVLCLLVATGLRRGELLALDWVDLDLDTGQPSLLVRHGKGGKPRRQPLPLPLARKLGERRDTIKPRGDQPVICGLAGKRLTVSVLCALVRRAAERAAIDKHVTPHTLRHTAATWLRQETGDARLVAAYLGHADLSTVSRYAHVAPAELHTAAAALADRMTAPDPAVATSSRPGWSRAFV